MVGEGGVQELGSGCQAVCKGVRDWSTCQKLSHAGLIFANVW